MSTARRELEEILIDISLNIFLDCAKNYSMATQTEENYIKAIYKITEKNQGSANTNAIAAHLSTTPASVTDMIKKLSAKDYFHYEKYRGVQLTEKGIKVATELIRKHRLWEVFLVDKLGFSWEEVHDLAEELEHIDSKELITRMDNFLGNPKFDPHGDPIPNAEGRYTLRNQIALSEFSVGEAGTLIGVKVHDRPFLEHLNSLNIKLGSEMSLVEKNNYDGAVTILLDSENQMMLSHKVCSNLLLRRNH